MGGPFQPPINVPGLGRGSSLMELTGSWFTHAAQVVWGICLAAHRTDLTQMHQGASGRREGFCHDQFSDVFTSSEIFVKPDVFCAGSGFGAPG